MGFETLEAVENQQLQIIDLKKENIALTESLKNIKSEMELLKAEIKKLKK